MNLSYSLVALMIPALCVSIACSTSGTLAKSAIDRRFASYAADPAQLGAVRADAAHTMGRSGYFYIIGTDGRIRYHPQRALIGLSFMENRFVKRLIESREGCIEQNIEGRYRIIKFKMIDTARILCFSVSSDEVDRREFRCDEFK